MKKLFTLLTLAVLSIGSAWAANYSDESSSVAWAFTSHEDLSSTNTPTDAFLSTNVSVGSNLSASTVSKNGKNNSWGKTYSMVMFKPIEIVAKNTGEKAENTLTFTITPAQGITFTPTKVSFIGCNAGATGDPKTAAYVVYSDNSKETVMSAVNMNRDDKAEVTSPTIVDYTLEHAVAGKLTIKIYMDALTNTSKGVAFTNIVVTGTVSGTPVAVTTYNLTVTANDSGLGSVTGAGTYAENEAVTLTASAKAGGFFVKWQKDGADFSGNDTESINVNVTADATYTAIFGEFYSVSYNVANEYKGTSETGFSKEYANAQNKWTAPQNYYAASEGLTLTKWTDGTNDYIPGTEYTLANSITLEPVFEDKGSINIITSETKVTWPFGTGAGAPTLSSEGNTQYYVQRATVAGQTIDVPIFVNTVKNYGINGKTGKFNNTSNSSYAQVNAGTVFKIPAIKNMIVEYSTNQTSAVGNIGFTDNTSDLGGDGSALTNPTNISSDNKTVSYTYTGTASYLYLVDIAGGKYPTNITVTYPETQTKYQAPTIAVGDFNFENKGYKVTITASEGTLEVSTDGTNYTEQVSPYETYTTETTTYYAKVTGTNYDDSDVAEKEVINTFDSSKKYVAWVYTKGYGAASYTFDGDPMVQALQDVYNVVEVNNSADTAPSADLANADLIVCTEAMTGNKALSNGMKSFVGTTPMIGLKMFNYTKGRWSWGTPANPSPTATSFTPKSQLYKVLSGVTFEADGTIQLSTATSGNVVQTVQFGTSDTTEPTDNVILGTIGDDDTKAMMHAAGNYFGLGLSSDAWSSYTANAVTIVKNAAAMLIAGEDLTSEVVSIAITSAGWATFSCTKEVAIPEGVTAYVVSKKGEDKVTLSEIEGYIPAETGVVVSGDEGTYAATITNTDASISTTNYLVAWTTAGEPSENDYYTLAVDGNGPLFKKSSGGILAAGKAYLVLPTSGEARLSIDFDGGVTTIAAPTAIATMEAGKAEVYNLQGQRVSTPTKGLYIVGGKKVMKK